MGLGTISLPPHVLFVIFLCLLSSISKPSSTNFLQSVCFKCAKRRPPVIWENFVSRGVCTLVLWRQFSGKKSIAEVIHSEGVHFFMYPVHLPIPSSWAAPPPKIISMIYCYLLTYCLFECNSITLHLLVEWIFTVLEKPYQAKDKCNLFRLQTYYLHVAQLLLNAWLWCFCHSLYLDTFVAHLVSCGIAIHHQHMQKKACLCVHAHMHGQTHK